MSWAMELSPSGFDAMLTDLSHMDRKTGRAYLQLLGYLRRFGSVPAGERALASVLNVSVRFLREIAWPLLEDRLVLSEDKRRYFDPDITAANPRRAAGAPAATVKASQQQEAANARWGKNRQRAEAHPQAHAERMESDAQAHTNSMRGASETHAKTDADASSDASDASPRVPASPPPLKQDSFFQPTGKEESLGGGGTRAPASDDAPADAPTHARTHKNDAPTHAQPHADSVRPIRPDARPIAPDWQPSAETRAEAERLGVDVDAEIKKFVLRALDKDLRSKDWDASFLLWCHRQVEWAKRHPQAEAPIVIQGGKADQPEPEPEDEPIVGTGPEAQWQRATRRLKAEIGAGVYRTWLSKAAVVGIEDGEVTISLPTEFIRDYVRGHYLDRLAAFWRADNPSIIRVQAIVAAPERRTADG